MNIVERRSAILDDSLEYQVRVSNKLKRNHNVHISAGGVRSVWIRNGIENKNLRLKRLEKWAKEEKNILTESQVQALEPKKDGEEAHGEVETHHSGFLFAQDTYYVGHIKGVGKIYQQTGIDTFSNTSFTKLYFDKA